MATGVLVAADYADRAKTDQEYVEDKVFQTVFKNDALIGPVIPLRGSKDGEYVRINFYYSANSSVEYYQEGQDAPNRGKQAAAATKFIYRSWRAMVGETGHALRRRGSNSAGIRGSDDEMVEAMKDIRDKMTTDFLAASQTYSIDGIINDSTVNWGDVSRSTYDTTVSYLLAASSAGISTALLNKAKWRSKEAPYGARVEYWMSAPLQGGLVAEVAAGKLALNDVGGRVGNVIVDDVAASEPWITMPDMLTSTIVGFTGLDDYWGYTNNEQGDMAGPNGGMFRTRLYGAQDDSDTLQISTAGCVWCTQPQKQIKITGLSTG
ncbi:MAG: hypothetical protein ACYTBJ_02400 [Planctomycetota bacterium]|jgi:hypothetical protein